MDDFHMQDVMLILKMRLFSADVPTNMSNFIAWLFHFVERD